MADAAVDTTTTTEINTKDLKGKQEAVEEVKEVEKENGSGDAPANGNGAANGASHDEETPANEGEEEAGDGEKAENGAEEPADSHAVKRPAEEEESADTKKQKTENGDSTEAEVKA
ncbi:parathymosin isoform X1 [Chanos chanos]|uniref:Parathymosin isoform X1 n=1 Tax=Chanos chanos TaxID=29144 RepID=A0A6J2VNB6_CHACN|nr:parathymosin-like isoform X1 [Chanos chanos]